MMEIKQQTDLVFGGVNIVKVEFFNETQLNGAEFTLSTNCGYQLPKEIPNLVSIVMDVDIQSENSFRLYVRAVGLFQLREGIDTDLRKQYININAPAIMFPYVRAFVSTFTSNCGMNLNTLNLPPQTFQGELVESHRGQYLWQYRCFPGKIDGGRGGGQRSANQVVRGIWS